MIKSRVAVICVLVMLAFATIASACYRCEFFLSCDPNCEIVEYCVYQPFPRIGFPTCSSNQFGCFSSGPACLWA